MREEIIEVLEVQMRREEEARWMTASEEWRITKNRNETAASASHFLYRRDGCDGSKN